MRLFFITLLSLLLVACAQAPTRIRLDPEVRYSNERMANGQEIAVWVRTPFILPTLKDKEFRFGLENAAEAMLQQHLLAALNKLGFQGYEGENGPRRLVAERITMDNRITDGTFSDQITIDVSITLTAHTPAGQRSRTFNNSVSRHIAGNASIGDVAGDLNLLVGDTITKAVSDKDLLGFLAH